MKIAPCRGRALVSLLMALGFILVSVSGALLFFAPGGHGGQQQAWAFLGLDKRGWMDLHIVFGFLFIFAGLVHLWLNRKPFLNYLGTKVEVGEAGCEAKEWRPEGLIALVLCIGLAAGALSRSFPVSYLWDLRDAVRGTSGNGPGPQRVPR